MKSREPLWLPYILGKQNSIDVTTNDMKSLRNSIGTKTVYISTLYRHTDGMAHVDNSRIGS